MAQKSSLAATAGIRETDRLIGLGGCYYQIIGRQVRWLGYSG